MEILLATLETFIIIEEVENIPISAEPNSSSPNWVCFNCFAVFLFQNCKTIGTI